VADVELGSDAGRHDSGPGLLRGDGPPLGRYATEYAPPDRSLLRVLADQARSRPDATWLVFDGTERLTFAAARDEVECLAAGIRASAVPGTTVALLMRNRIEFMPVLLAAQAAGCVSVPLNPELRGPMLSALLTRCDARTVVVEPGLFDRLTELDDLGPLELIVVCGAEGALPPLVGSVPVQALADWRGGERLPLADVRPDSSAVAMLMFTSGTSGGSKAAIWTHHYLYLSSATVADALQFGPAEVLSTPLQMCHIAGLQVFAGASLHAGCTAHLKSRFSASSFWDEAAQDGTTFSMLMGPMTAAILRAVPEAPEHRIHTLYVLPQPAERAEFEQRYRTRIVWQGWGMTEIFPHLPRRERIEDVPADTIGAAPSWVDFGVVDEFDRLLPPGSLGEMVYRPLLPDAMASGYYGDPSATSRAFRNFMFHTGDLGYYDEDRRVHFVMRNQDSIRVRGENVSAVELEAIALTHPLVDEAAAYAVDDAGGDREIKLDVVSGEALDLPTLHEWLSGRLPRFMVPRYVERRSSLPRTPSQRVEKYKLAADGVRRPGVLEVRRTRRH
jgi:crotonobetaine/carnitine-CoA ligase